MSPKCPNCGYEPPKGRPKKVDDVKVRNLREKGLSLQQISDKLGVTRGAVQASIKRTEYCRCDEKEGDNPACRLHRK